MPDRQHNIQIPLMQFYINGLRYDNQEWPTWTVTGADGVRASVDSHLGYVMDRLASVSAELNDLRANMDAANRIIAESLAAKNSEKKDEIPPSGG